MSLDKVISTVTQSKLGRKFCTYVADPKNEKFVNSTLPVGQQALAEVMGVAITVFNPKMETEQKKSQLINHGLKAACNLTLVGAASSATASFAHEVAKELDTRGVSKAVQNGVKIGFPLLTACVLSRFLIPVLLNPISSKLRDKYNEKFCKNKGESNNNTAVIPENTVRSKYEALTFNNYKKATRLNYNA